ncbi:response regulator [Corallococcus macrosporus]|uniref:Response regulator n=1 Tax=Corallococcus macrosporus TaxID=35 RepID=A0ABS3D9D3_9BACT|nr:response regulator [Corallococcus macrosporus]MBN8227562.1 response regulator [Corallococcus macrosporus]
MSTILLVDDDTEILEILSEVLGLLGHRTLLAQDGEQALALALRERPDLVVTDCMMPRMTGVELCTALAQVKEFQGLPIIMHSASQNPHAPGVLTFLLKSGDLTRFVEVVTRTLEEARRRAARAE